MAGSWNRLPSITSASTHFSRLEKAGLSELQLHSRGGGVDTVVRAEEGLSVPLASRLIVFTNYFCYLFSITLPPLCSGKGVLGGEQNSEGRG